MFRRDVSLRHLLTTESLFLGLLGILVLWRGGKSMDILWISSFSLPVLTYFFLRCNSHQRSSGPSLILQYALASFVLATVVSWMFSQSKNYGYDEVLATLIAVIVCGIGQIASQDFTSRISRALSIFLLLACGIGTYVYVTEPVSRFVGSFFDARFHTDYWPNAWADFVLLTWPLLLHTLPFHSTRFSHRCQAHAILAFVLAAGALSYSRAGILVALGQITLVLGGCLWITSNWRARRHTLLSVIGVAAVSSLIFLLINSVRAESFPLESVQRKATFTSDEGRSSLSERASFFQQSLALLPSYALVGSGPGTFRFLQPALQQSILATADHPHNVFLKIALERGLIALASLFMISILTVHAVIRRLRTPEWTSHDRLSMLIAVGCVGVASHSLVDFNLQFLGILVPGSFFIGALLQNPSSMSTESQASHHLMSATAILLFILVLIETPSQVLASYGRHARDAEQFSAAETAFSRAKKISFFPRDLFLESAHLRLKRHDASGELQDLVDYTVQNPHDYRSWRVRADLLLSQNNVAAAREAYRTADQLGARYNDPSVFLGILRTLPDQKAFADHRFEFDSLLNDYSFAILSNTHFFALGDGADTVLSIIDQMMTLVPHSDAPLYQALRERLLQHIQVVRSTYRAHLSPAFSRKE